jgi:CDP-ribitol ribitolphosphotransferase
VSAEALDPAELRGRLPTDYALVLKPHPNVAASSLATDGYDVLIDPAEEVNAVLALTDILITDYSSAVFEFALLRRPMVLMVGDLAEYARDPGVCVDVEHGLVGALVVDTAGVAAAILEDRFDLSGYDALIEQHMSSCDGRSSARFVDTYAADLRPRRRRRRLRGRRPAGTSADQTPPRS